MCRRPPEMATRVTKSTPEDQKKCAVRTHLGLLAVPAKLSCPNFENKIAAIGPLLVYFVPSMRFHSKGTLPRPFIYIHIK